MSKDTKKRHTNLTMIHLFESHLFNLSSVKQQRVVFLCLFDSSSCWSCWFFSISMMFHLGLVPLFILAWHLNSQLLAGLNLCNNYVSTVNPKLSYKSPEDISNMHNIRCLLVTIDDSDLANSGNHVSSEYFIFFFVQPLFSALNFCIGIFHEKFDLFIQMSAVAKAAAAAE